MARDETIALTTLWRVDEQGFLITPSGAKVARVAGSRLMLYDKRVKTEWPFTVLDWLLLMQHGVDEADRGSG